MWERCFPRVASWLGLWLCLQVTVFFKWAFFFFFHTQYTHAHTLLKQTDHNRSHHTAQYGTVRPYRVATIQSDRLLWISLYCSLYLSRLEISLGEQTSVLHLKWHKKHGTPPESLKEDEMHITSLADQLRAATFTVLLLLWSKNSKCAVSPSVEIKRTGRRKV